MRLIRGVLIVITVPLAFFLQSCRFDDLMGVSIGHTSGGAGNSGGPLISLGNTETLPGNGDIVTQKRAAENFRSVKISGAYNLDFSEQPESSLEISADSNIIDKLPARIRGGVLLAESPSGDVRPSKTPLLKASAPALDSVSVSGESAMTLTGDNFQSLKVAVSGAASLTASGAARELDIKISGSGAIDLSKFDVEKLRISISGSGSAIVRASKSLDVSISGVGSVTCLNRPERINQRVSGLGKVLVPRENPATP